MNINSGRRHFLVGASQTLLVGALVGFGTRTVGALAGASGSTGERMLRVQRLSWAGVKLVCGDTTVLIDPWANPDSFGGDWKDPVAPIVVDTPHCLVLITHIHADHFDPNAIKAVFDKTPGTVICHSKVAAFVASRGLRTRALETYEPLVYNAFTVAPVPAVDAYDDDQVSWVVSAGGKRVIHCGDTLWHGAWWKIGKQYGPFDLACLPINGFKSKGDNPDSDIPADLTPEQAAAAGVVLGAKLIMPIHYGIRGSQSYIEYPNAESAFVQFARQRQVPVELVKPGEWVTWKPNR